MSSHQAIIERFVARFEARYHVPPAINGAATGALLKRWRRQFGDEAMLERVDRFWALTDTWWARRDAYTFSSFLSAAVQDELSIRAARQSQRLRERPAPVNRWAWQADPAHPWQLGNCQHQPRCLDERVHGLACVNEARAAQGLEPYPLV